jgi:hypothetical protein
VRGSIPLQEQGAASGGATEPLAPPYEDKFSQKIKSQSKDDIDLSKKKKLLEWLKVKALS